MNWQDDKMSKQNWNIILQMVTLNIGPNTKVKT